MSEVMRYDEYTCGVHECADYGEYVKSVDFDRVTAERDAALGREAALREDLSTANGCLNEWRRSTLGRTLLENTALQQRLTAAYERADVLIQLLREGLEEYKDGDDWIDRVIAALKPAEGGGDE